MWFCYYSYIFDLENSTFCCNRRIFLIIYWHPVCWHPVWFDHLFINCSWRWKWFFRAICVYKTDILDNWFCAFSLDFWSVWHIGIDLKLVPWLFWQIDVCIKASSTFSCAGEWQWPFRGIRVGEARHPGPPRRRLRQTTEEDEDRLFGMEGPLEIYLMIVSRRTR